MKDFLNITKALADETRLRVLMLLEPGKPVGASGRDSRPKSSTAYLPGGELCLCQLVAVLQLSPSTVSKHVSILTAAGLVQSRKEGRWRYYKLAGRGAPEPVRQALKWVRTHLQEEAQVCCDREACCAIAEQPLEEVSCCYR